MTFAHAVGAGGGRGGKGTEKPVSKPAQSVPPLSHMPVIDFVATFTQPAYYGLNTQVKNYDPLDLGGSVRIPVTRKFSLLFDRITGGTINQPLECVIQGGARVCSADTR